MPIVTRCQNNIFYYMIIVHLKLIRAFSLIFSIDIFDNDNDNNINNKL